MGRGQTNTNHTAAWITQELIIEVFATYEVPDMIYSDRNFESAVLHQTLPVQKFGVHKSRTAAYHAQGVGW